MNYIEEVKQDLQKKIDVSEDLLDLYTLLVLTRGVQTTWEDVHDAWSVWKNNYSQHHPSLIPFDELTETIQKMDKEYADAIKETAKAVNPRKISF